VGGDGDGVGELFVVVGEGDDGGKLLVDLVLDTSVAFFTFRSA
jgi:hypothetical protein